MTDGQATVFVVDDDQAVRESLAWLIESVDLPVETFADADAFLAALDPERPGCLVTDVRMPGTSGVELQRLVGERHPHLPVILVTGHGDIQMAVRAMKDGAFDFVEKPYNDQVLLDLIQKAVAQGRHLAREHARHSDISARAETLTPREREVLDLVATGEANKGIAHRLGISEKTVEVHRARVMTKMKAKSLQHLMKLVVTLEGHQGKP